MSESFRNVASNGSVSVPKSGAVVSTGAGTVTLSFSYDAGTQAYTVSDGTLTRTFGPGAIDASQSTPTLTTYKYSSGGTTEYLSITVPDIGTGKTRYVGGGFWQRQVDSASAVNGTFVSFSYGVKTPDGALPRTGTASFDVNLLGARSFSSDIYALSGTGVLNVDFQSGAIAASGRYDEANAVTGMGPKGMGWKANALIASSSNGFNGTIALDDAGSGEFHGALFGPNAEEVGASFSTNPNSDVASTGTIYGARGTNVVNQPGTTIDVPASDVFYRPISRSIKAQLDASGTVASASDGTQLVAIYWSKNGGNPTLFSADGRITAPLPIPGQPLNYDLTRLGLNYTRPGLAFDRRTTLSQVDAFVYGFDTTNAALPRTGTAAFNVTMNGAVASPGAKLQTLSGYGSITANLAAGTLSTLGTYTVTNTVPMSGVGGGAATDSGSWTGTGTIAASSNAFTSSLTMTGGTTYTGDAAGAFFGPAAEEIGATFQASAANGARAVGTLAGGRGSDSSASQIPLADLTARTTLSGTDAQYYAVDGLSPGQMTYVDGSIDVTYDPADKSYVFKSTATGVNPGTAIPVSVTVSQSDLDAARSDATFNVYHSANYDAQIFKPGAGNPKIALTYTSFAVINQSGVKDGRATRTEYYIPFGGQTPNFQMPKTGTASYSGVVYGGGYDGIFKHEASLSGTSKLNVNFGTGNIGLSADLISTDRTNGASQALGVFQFNSSGVPCSSACVNNSFFVSATGGASGAASGKFFGPNAAEFGANFTLNIPSPNGQSSSSSTFAGAIVGKKD